MTTARLRPQIADYAHLEPLPDPPREPDMLQDHRIRDFYGLLQLRFAYRDDVLIAGGGYLRRQAGNGDEIFAPDCVVAFGVNPAGIVARNGYVISEVGKPPDFVLEVASRRTGERDYTIKREGYAGYGVQEYWRFDHTGGLFHDAPLAGDTLAEGRYEPLPVNCDPDGLIWGYSPMLDLEICWDAGEVQLRDHYTKEFMPKPRQERRIRDAETARAESERQARLAAESERRAAEARAVAEREARLAAEERIRLLEAELEGRGDT